MDENEAISLLYNSLFWKDLLHDSETTTELLKELTYLPLAITQAAAYLNRNQVTIAKYLSLLRGTEHDVTSLISREFYDNTRYKGSQNAVATTWLVSFEQIRKSNSAAAHLLSFISCIELKAIPLSILPDLGVEEQMVQTIGTLCAYAFLFKHEGSETYEIHSLVHVAMRIWLQKDNLLGQAIEDAIRHLENIFPLHYYENRTLWRAYLPHALRVLQRQERIEIEERYDLSLRVGQCLREDGRIREAVRCLDDAYRWRKSNFSETHPSRLVSQHELAWAYEADGQVKKAVELLEHIVRVQEILAENHPDRLASQHTLAAAYEADGQVKKAVELQEHVVRVQETLLAEDHPSRLASQHALATVYRADGQVKKAGELQEHVVRVQETSLTEDHPSRLSSQHELARAYEADRQVKKATELLEHVVRVQETSLAEDHPSRLASRDMLLSLYIDYKGQL